MSQKKLILSIDGGGVRGLIAATVLALLEKDLQASLYETFDMYAGSSVGSWLVLAISGMQYSGEQILSLFTEDNVNQIFSKSFLSALNIVSGPKYKGEGKRAVLNQLFSDKKFLSIQKQTLITAYDIINNQAVVFKSQGESSDALYDPTIAEVADASSAAPTYFPPVQSSDTPSRWLVDGGIVANDPALCIITEALKNGVALADLKVLSLGSGVADKLSSDPQQYGKASQSWGALQWLEHGLINDLFSGNTTVTEYQISQLLKERYLRINDTLALDKAALDKIDPDNLKALTKIGEVWYQANREHVQAWLAI